MMPRSSGLLLPFFSLPSAWGIGSLGPEAYAFVDFLADLRQSYWQVLPLGPTNSTAGHSPYSAMSSFAGNPYLIDLQDLIQEGLLSQEACSEADWGERADWIDYVKIEANKLTLLRRAFDSFQAQERPSAYDHFCKDHQDWLEDYALYQSIRALHGSDWLAWPENLKRREPQGLQRFIQAHQSEIDFERFLQYTFFRQYGALKQYANQKGIQMIGDLPIYMPMDSADCWAHPEYFQLDADLRPRLVSGVPPDGYSPDGQRWNHPLYDWDKLAEESYAYWVFRVRHQMALFDVLRLDHFIGFIHYYAIPAAEKTAKNGTWLPGPGQALFDRLQAEIPELNFIIEDLGTVTPAVRDLQKKLAFPGMRVIQFAFGGDDSDNLPHNYEKNAVVYSSTHDSDTFLGWYEQHSEQDRQRIAHYLQLQDQEGIHWGAIRALLASVCRLTIFPVQDLFGLGNEARINVPGIASGNWAWRLALEDQNGEIKRRMLDYMKTYYRAPREESEVKSDSGGEAPGSVEME